MTGHFALWEWPVSCAGCPARPCENDLFPVQVVLLDLEVLAEISSSAAGKHFPLRTGQQFMLSPAAQKAIKSSHHMNDYFTVFILSLMHLFSTDQQLLDDRGSFIIRWAVGIIHLFHLSPQMLNIFYINLLNFNLSGFYTDVYNNC